LVFRLESHEFSVNEKDIWTEEELEAIDQVILEEELDSRETPK
jgi:hypothetical protein